MDLAFCHPSNAEKFEMEFLDFLKNLFTPDIWVIRKDVTLKYMFSAFLS
jgi:hypothetical protein